MLFEAEPQVDIREMNPLSLAFMGDGVLELLVRQHLVERSRLLPGKLHAEAVRYVSARSQFLEMKLLEPMLTEEEHAVFRRGKNANKATVAKHASVEEYRTSTGFECLLGWLYLKGRNERIMELMDVLWREFEPETQD
ncbi:MAG: ribonuclease III domain-containing protein [Subdoligranulum sp.]|nr:cysteine--tRNA ligase [Subdoligranulum sp.]MDD7264719.1 ribonuclease III domain-containing protein [Subdoligranulum sp.]